MTDSGEAAGLVDIVRFLRSTARRRAFLSPPRRRSKGKLEVIGNCTVEGTAVLRTGAQAGARDRNDG